MDDVNFARAMTEATSCRGIKTPLHTVLRTSAPCFNVGFFVVDFIAGVDTNRYGCSNVKTVYGVRVFDVYAY